MTLQSFEYLVRGRVHGVGFRYFLRETARAEGVVGWVKNDLAGHVVGMAQGHEAALSKFKQALNVGPRHAEVTGVDISSECTIPRLQYQSFDITHH